MRLIVRCDIQRVPVEVEIEGASLDPSRAGKFLGSCLEEIDGCLEKITLEKVNQRGGQPGMPTSPGPSPASQTPQPQEATP